jgi:glycine/D-amino acid oxidase-like deaminating enzyme
MMKVGVIGAGAVGSAALLSLTMRGAAREIVVLIQKPQAGERSGHGSAVRRGVVSVGPYQLHFGFELSSALSGILGYRTGRRVKADRFRWSCYKAEPGQLPIKSSKCVCNQLVTRNDPERRTGTVLDELIVVLVDH